MRTRFSCLRRVCFLGGLSLTALGGTMPIFAEMAAAQTVRTANGVGSPFELSFWQSVDGSGDPAQYDAYLGQYPDGTFSALARIKIASLRKGAAPAAEMVVTKLAPVPDAFAPEPSASVVQVADALPVPDASPAGDSDPTALSPASATAASPQPAPMAAAGQTAGLAALLASLAESQESVPAGISAQPGSGFALPPHPQMVHVPKIAFPASFCSAEARNAFHNRVYQTALRAAKSNNDTASGYLRQLQGIYDGYKLGQETTAMNELVAQARAYQPEAAHAFAVQTALVGKFSDLMAVPIRPCEAAL
jgi:hypothetical protein